MTTPDAGGAAGTDGAVLNSPAMDVTPDPDAGQIDRLGSPISLVGRIEESLLTAMLQQIDQGLAGEDSLVLELTTQGGDADIGRRMALEVGLARQRLRNRRFAFLGKTYLYSAGVTVMAGFPREDRYLTRDTMLLIHCRQHEATISISGPIRPSITRLEALRAELEAGVALEKEGFERLIEGSDVTLDELLEKALYNWYVPAEEALARGLVAGVI